MSVHSWPVCFVPSIAELVWSNGAGVKDYAKYSANTCVECPDSEFLRVLIGLAFVAASIVAMGFMVRKNAKSIAPPTVDDALAGYKKDSELVLVTLKIATSFLQVQSFCAHLDLSWPGVQEAVFTAQSAVSEASSTAIFAACMLESDETPFVLSIAQFYVMFPFLIIAGVSVVYFVIGAVAWQKRRKRTYRVSAAAVGDESGEQKEKATGLAADSVKSDDAHVFDEAFSAIVVLLFLIYPSVWKQILIVFSCFTLDEEDGSLPKLDVMQADVGVDCSSDVHQTTRTYALITSIIIGFGVPFLSWWQMWGFYKAREMHTDRCRKRYGFLYKGFERPLYFWELVITARKTCIVVAQMAVRKYGARMQAIASLLILLIALFLNITYKRTFTILSSCWYN